jgi:hypothetical protein
MVIGSYVVRSITRPGLVNELLVGSTWYRNPAAVQNGYSAVGFRAFRARFCQRYNGFSCPGALTALLADEPTTGRPWVDLLSISTLVMYRPNFTAAVLARPPAGWVVAATSQSTVTWVRDDVVPTAGGIVWTTAGVRVGEQSGDSRSVRFRVDGIPADGGTVVLSRLAWPGYTASGASLAAPTARMLVTVHLDPSSAGRVVIVAWNPPGWRLERAAWGLAILGGLAWSLAVYFVRRRNRLRASVLSGGSGQVVEDDTSVEGPSLDGREDQPEDIR